MIKQLQKSILNYINDIIQVSLENIEIAIPLLESFLDEVTKYNSAILKLVIYCHF